MTTASTTDAPDSPGWPLPNPDTQPEQGEAARPRRSTARSIAVVGALGAGLVGLVVLLYACSIHAIPGDSDGATVVLQGQAYTEGHVLLHGWALSLDSFWAVDAVIYTILVAIAGVRPGLLYAGPAIIAAGVIVVGCLMAREGRRGGAAVAGCVTVIALLGLPTHTLAYFFLRGPLHIGTALWGLIAFAAIRRGRFGVGWVVSVLFLAGGMLGDLQAVAYAVIPVGIAGLVAMLRERNWRAGIAQVAAALTAVVVDEVVRKVRNALGGFTIGAANPIAGRHELLKNVKHVFTYGSEFFGIKNTLFMTGGVPSWLQHFHAVGAAVAAASVIGALVLLLRGLILGPRASRSAGAATAEASAPAETPDQRGTRRHQRSPAPLWRLDDMLLIATFGPAGAFVVLAVTPDPQYTRYLTASIVFASCLAGRMVARAWPHLGHGVWAKAVAGVGIAAVLLFGASVGYTLAQPDPGQPAGQLVSWLEAHHLDNGVSDYWSASVTTVQSHGRVTVRPVVTGSHGTLRRYTKQSASSWYQRPFQFFVWDTQLPWGGDDTNRAIATWGTPLHINKVGPYWVLQWPYTLKVDPNPAPGS